MLLRGTEHVVLGVVQTRARKVIIVEGNGSVCVCVCLSVITLQTWSLSLSLYLMWACSGLCGRRRVIGVGAHTPYRGVA